MTINIRIKADKVTICQENEHQGFLKVLNGLADDLEAIAQGKSFHKEENYYMALSAAEQAVVTRFDVATTAISNKIDALIAAGPGSPEFIPKLQALADSLDLLGKPTEPLPGPGPQPTP